MAVFCGVLMVGAMPRQRDVRFIIGKYQVVAEIPTPTPVKPAATPAAPQEPPRTTDIPRPNPLVAPVPVAPPPPPPAPVFHIPADLRFFLVIGSDARHWQDMADARADSIHVVAIDPVSRMGTVLGIPRDSWVNIPGRGMNKINAALVYGGPNLLTQTVRELTGMPISHWALTGFAGIEKIVDTLGGVDIYVPYDMKDRYSGADFREGWQHMDGPDVLAFSRARYGVPGGDFGRSENHGRVMIDSLRKMRKEVKTGGDLQKWLDVLYGHARLDMSIKDAFELGLLARKILPDELKNVVAPGRTGTADRQSVVFLEEAAMALFRDIAADAYADGDYERQPPKVDPTPKPKATPTPTPPPLLPLPADGPGPTPTPSPAPVSPGVLP